MKHRKQPCSTEEMGTISQRVRKDGSIGYTAQIRLKRGGKVIYTESNTFDRKPAAESWLTKRERELAQPGALETAKQTDPLLSEIIGRYMRESRRSIGKTKKQVLEAIQVAPIGQKHCSKIGSADLVQFAQSLKVKPQTVENYMSHLSAIFRIARPAWSVPLDDVAMQDARKVLKQLGQTGKSKQRERRPTLDELDKIMEYYGEMEKRERAELPMRQIIVFAIFSTRRQEEICTVRREDYQGDRILVRDMKHPGQKIGNDTWCDLPPEARRVIDALPKAKGPLFPFNHRSISASFTRACQFLEIEDLHFHDLRHHGISRLFELGWTIPHVAAVSGHRSWSSLKRYTHMREKGDCMEGWKWLDIIAPIQATPES